MVIGRAIGARIIPLAAVAALAFTCNPALSQLTVCANNNCTDVRIDKPVWNIRSAPEPDPDVQPTRPIDGFGIAVDLLKRADSWLGRSIDIRRFPEDPLKAGADYYEAHFFKVTASVTNYVQPFLCQ